MRKWIIAIAALLTVPMVGAAAVIVVPPVQEQLVEGHTVFTVVQARDISGPDGPREEFAAAVAVLVREKVEVDRYYDRFPGVLWFNDQYLVNPSSSQVGGEDSYYEYPCVGAVIAFNAGTTPVPTSGGVVVVPPTATYNESYQIVDPNDKTWHVDKWEYDPDGNVSTADSYFIWSVALMNNQATYGTADTDATHAREDSGCNYVDSSSGCRYQVPPWHTTPGDIEGTGVDSAIESRAQCRLTLTKPAGYPAGLRYNALLFFRIADLTAPGAAKNHALDQDDATACHDTIDDLWPCPGGNDHDEGNSHPYNPEREWPEQMSVGRNNHGGSTTCGENAGGGAQYMHATCNIDVYYGYVQATVPTPRQFNPDYYDTVGKMAPYHCHEDMDVCNEDEFHSAL